MTLNILIVDDDSRARRYLRGMLASRSAALCGVVEEAADAVRAAGLMRHRRFDLLLLDVQMPGDSGLALAEALRWWPERPAVVFVTGYPEHALEAFEADAIDYITKPVRPERLERALAKAVHRQPATPAAAADARESLSVVVRGQAQRLPLSEVLYLRAERKRITVVTEGGKFSMDGTLADFETRHADALLRVHRHTLAARRAIVALQRVDPAQAEAEGVAWQLRLRGTSETLPVARRMVASVRASVLAVRR